MNIPTHKRNELPPAPLQHQKRFLGIIENDAVEVQFPETTTERPDVRGLVNRSWRNCYFTASIHTQGDTSTPSVIKILCTDLAGRPLRIPNNLLRVRVCNDGLYEEATNATIAATNGSTLVDTITSTKDIVITSANNAQASLTTALTGNNNDLIWTVKAAGSGGNSYTLAYVNPGTASATESVAVVGTAITVNLATTAGTAQVETVTAATQSDQGPTEDGILTVDFVSALTGTLAVPVALLDADADDDAVAVKIRAALAANATIDQHFVIGGTGAAITVTAKVAAANDATLSVTWGGYIGGVNAASSSTNTTAGVAPAISSTGDTIKTTVAGAAAVAALVTVVDAAGNDGSGTVTALSATPFTGGGTGAQDEFYVALTNAQAETVTVREAEVPCGRVVNSLPHFSLDVTHAAP